MYLATAGKFFNKIFEYYIIFSIFLKGLTFLYKKNNSNFIMNSFLNIDI